MTKEQVKEPVTLKEAMSSPEGERWIDAMEKEMRSKLSLGVSQTTKV